MSLPLIAALSRRRPHQVVQCRETAARHHGHAGDEEEDAHTDQRCAARRRSGRNGDKLCRGCRRIYLQRSAPSAPGNRRGLRARIGFQPSLELCNHLRERLGKRNLLCIIVVRTQPLGENLANTAVRRAVEQGRIIRCHGTFLRRAGVPVERANARIGRLLGAIPYTANACAAGAFPQRCQTIMGVARGTALVWRCATRCPDREISVNEDKIHRDRLGAFKRPSL